jgi:ABC-type multidrug transport system fused ATPase/permease subunit
MNVASSFTIVKLLKFNKELFVLATVLASSMIFFDGIGIGLIVVLLDGIQGASGSAQQSTFSNLPLFGQLASVFSALGSTARLQTVAVLLAALAIVRGVFTYARAMAQRRFEARTDLMLRQRAFARMMLGAIGDVGQEEASWHYNLLTSFPGQASAAIGRIVSIVSSLFSIAIIIGYVGLISVKLTVFAIVLLGVLMLLAQRTILPLSRRAGEAVNRFYIDFSQYVMDSIYGLLVIRAFAREKPRAEAFDSLLNRQFELGMRAQRWTSLAEPVYTAAVMISVAVLMFVGSQVITEDAQRIPALITFILILSRLIGPVGGLNEGMSYIVLQSNSVGILTQFLEAPVGRTITQGTQAFPGMRDSIRFEDVTFSYAPDRPEVLKGVSFTVRKGSFVALVGPSGGGKTTIVRLLTRLIDPVGGSIAVDGVDLRQYTAASWRQHIGVVPQETFLFNDTIAANLRFAKPSASDEEVITAAKAAHAHDFIMAQADGYQTVVGDRGSLFSGGQQQRLAIARALLASPEIIIMDEATSNLDAESETEIKRAITELSERCTVIVVAHRLSTVRSADKIIVISQGAVAEEGGHNELVAQEGIFARLINQHAAV